jgi:uncharacterized membrane protein YfcA
MLEHLTAAQWALAIVASLFIGMAKTGIAGIGTLAVAMYALIFPSRASVGIVLPLLIVGDIFAITAYRAHAEWKHLWRLFPWAGAGILAGYLVMNRIDGRQTQVLIGCLLIAMVGLHAWRKRVGAPPASYSSYWYAAFVGVFAGFATMTANAAGPLMVLYLLMMGLPKLQFMGTSAWFFCAVNLVKVPLVLNLGLLTADSLSLNAALVGFVIVGALAGKWVLHHIAQSQFEFITLVSTVLAAIKMLWPT